MYGLTGPPVESVPGAQHPLVQSLALLQMHCWFVSVPFGRQADAFPWPGSTAQHGVAAAVQSLPVEHFAAQLLLPAASVTQTEVEGQHCAAHAVWPDGQPAAPLLDPEPPLLEPELLPASRAEPLLDPLPLLPELLLPPSWPVPFDVEGDDEHATATPPSDATMAR